MNKKENIILSSNEISQIINELADNIKNNCTDINNLVFVGILTAGYPLAIRISKILQKECGVEIPVGKLDVALYRDDLLSRGKFITIRESDIPFDLLGKTLVIVDDVLFNGRTIRAALNALLDFGRPNAIELAVLIDRGFRELPVYANYVGRKIDTEKEDHISVKLYEINGEDSVFLEQNN
ncbi:MAG: bifunctional pyr operon transcriptional regulator/uracil phosphoribosyltransferase PyrR [bacterium]|nr:bifunctional pyr operon transcriptional regulator/uracil phosphoribosyltransferase PyrR [bacterium]